MKLLGLEFKDFACFDQQFIRAEPGINLLVGRNNAGKTAILRGLTTLASLPLDQVRPLDPLLKDYARGVSAGEPSFDLDIHFQYQPTDISLFAISPQDWKSFSASEYLEIVYKFRVFTLTSHVVLLQATLKFRDGVNLDLIEFEQGQGGAFRKVYDLQRKHASSQKLDHNAASGHPGGITHYLFKRGNPFFSGLEELSFAKFISPHRVPVATMQMQTVTRCHLMQNELPGFLQTLQGNNGKHFRAIQSFLTDVFPEFEYVNTKSVQNQVSITLTNRRTGKEIPLTHCGTGVEQMLALATFVITAPEGGIILLDEPHSFLHPTAERQLVEFLEQQTRHRVIVSTHSSILLNSVHPSRITWLEPPGEGIKTYRDGMAKHRPDFRTFLQYLGYRNSDLLFYDRLIFVEGPTDADVLPILLEKSGGFDASMIARSGFPEIGGAGSSKELKLQGYILRFERLLDAVGRARQPRLYVFDGDHSPDAKKTLAGTKNLGITNSIAVAFLDRREIENYLLVPEAICAALNEEWDIAGGGTNVDVETVSDKLGDLIRKESRSGADADLEAILKEIKGSSVLERLYDSFGCRYQKTKNGKAIARHISLVNQPALKEIVAKVEGVFR